MRDFINAGLLVLGAAWPSLAAVADSVGGGDALAAVGAVVDSVGVAAVLLVVVRVLWGELKARDARILELQEKVERLTEERRKGGE